MYLHLGVRRADSRDRDLPQPKYEATQQNESAETCFVFKNTMGGDYDLWLLYGELNEIEEIYKSKQ